MSSISLTGSTHETGATPVATRPADRSVRRPSGRRLTLLVASLLIALTASLVASPAASASTHHTHSAHWNHMYQVHTGARVIKWAKKYIGHGVQYVWGGTSPRYGWDCSGYTKYVYRHAGVKHAANLPHNAQAQRRVSGMRLESRSKARAGDLIFYISGGRAYHVAIYAGHGMQYAAADPQEDMVYQHVSSAYHEYRSIWHR